ncbi:MAG: hypothetical protein KF886_21940 [Candidatus Hydrogenedentes bacterium]|nr:hypothetical protein [Candidatus Hydrogenedentota bacterium]
MRWRGTGRLAALLLLAILLKLPLANCICGEIPATETPAWEVVISEANTSRTASSIGEASNGDLFLAGSATDGAGIGRPYLMRRTPEGEPIWEAKGETGLRLDRGFRLAVLPDDGVVVFFSSLSFPRGAVEKETDRVVGDYYLARIDGDGALLWEKKFGREGFNEAVDVVVLEDGFALLGTTDSRGSGGTDYELLRTDFDGNIRWSRTYGGAANDHAVDLEVTDDGGFALLGDSESMTTGFSSLYLVKTDAEGRQLWRKSYGIGLIGYAGGLVETDTGGFLLAGYADLQPFGFSEPQAILVDANGEVIWEKLLVLERYHRIQGAIAVSGGGYVLVGTVEENNTDAACETIAVLEVTGDGGFDRSRVYGAHYGTQGYQVIEARDGNFVVVGTSMNFRDSYSHNEAYLAKVEREGG